MRRFDAARRAALQRGAAAAGWLTLPAWAQTPATVTDGAGRSVAVPRKVERVFPAGPPAAIQIYTLAPDLLLGWPRANRQEELEFLLPGIGSRPELGRITGRGNTANLETVLALKPDLIVDAGSTRQTFVELADRVQAQTGVPYALLDGRFERIPASYTALGDLVGRRDRARELARHAEDTMATVRGRCQAVAPERRPRVYFARGPAGLETGLGGSINVEILEFLGLRNVAAELAGGLATVSIEQVLRWDPEVIIAIDLEFAAGVRENALWQGVRAVREGRVHLSPKLPFGWVDFPPGVNRLIGLWWLGKQVYPERFPEDLRVLTRDFYQRFYQVTPSDAQVTRVLAGRT
ncbi:MAG TPA: iron ABC transporter substrate-binding protein [Burkholderiaceae bacterium]